MENGKPQKNSSLLFIIFGATGDLTQRKLLPALYHLTAQQQLPEQISILCIGRKRFNDESYRAGARAWIGEHSHTQVDEEHLQRFLPRLHYRQMEFISEPRSYADLKNWVEESENQLEFPAVRLFFLAVAPEFFGLIVTRLRDHGLAEKRNPNHRVMIEKPFGSDLASARLLNATISDALDEQQIYRIDHYLGKEMIRNILAIRFGNSLFEPLWNHNYIDNIQIISTETLGVEGRGAYYEQSGILKDMLQNHLLQMLALITMEPPADLMPESIRDEKVKALRALRNFDTGGVCEGIALGQYGPGHISGKAVPGYREESEVAPETVVPTFIALRAHVDNFRWGGVPIYIRAGKRLDRQRTQIIIEFKRLPGINFYTEFKELPPNLLVIEVQPAEGMYFRINGKRPGNAFQMDQMELNYSQSIRFQGNVPEAYEQLILEAYRANSSLFTRWDELEHSWRFVESIEKICNAQFHAYPNYKAGSRGTERADQLVLEDGRVWREIDLPCTIQTCETT